MVFTRFVEIGRVAYIMEGPDAGKLCVIIDVIDQKKALVHGPVHGVQRQGLQFQKLSLLDYKIKIPRSAREKTIRKAWEKAELTKKWEESRFYKRIQLQKKRASLSDFDRFKVKNLKYQRNRIIRGRVKQIKKDQQQKK